MNPDSKAIQFERNRVQQGEYRICLDLTNLGDKAFEILQLAARLGFNSPQFVSDREQVYAILLREFHEYGDDPEVLFAHLDEQTETLWHACEPDAHLKMSIQSRFAKYLEPAIAA